MLLINHLYPMDKHSWPWTLDTYAFMRASVSDGIKYAERIHFRSKS